MGFYGIFLGFLRVSENLVLANYGICMGRIWDIPLFVLKKSNQYTLVKKNLNKFDKMIIQTHKSTLFDYLTASAEAGACANGGNRAKAGGSSTGFVWAESVGRFGNWGEHLSNEKTLVGWVI